MLAKAEVKKVLRSPYKPFVTLALELVNLKDKERLCIDLVDIKGNTIEHASEIMNCNPKTVKNHRNKALDKMCKAWVDSELVKKILEED